MPLTVFHAGNIYDKTGELEVKRLLLVFIIMATWIVVGCGTSTGGCFGHWVKGPGHHRGTRALLKDASLPYYQCVDENNKGSNLKERRYL